MLRGSKGGLFSVTQPAVQAAWLPPLPTAAPLAASRLLQTSMIWTAFLGKPLLTYQVLQLERRRSLEAAEGLLPQLLRPLPQKW